MTTLVLSILITITLAVLFAWLALRAWRSKRWFIKWPGVIISGLLGLLLVAIALVSTFGAYKLYAHQAVAIPDVKVDSSAEQVARGQHIAEVMCTDCHSNDNSLSMSGGRNMAADINLPLGDVYAPNLTSAGNLKNWSDGELFRLLRTGVNHNGRVTMMGMIGSRLLSDEDTLALIAYLRQSPAIENQTPPYKPSLLMALLTGGGMLKFGPASSTGVQAPLKAANAEYGKYVLGFADCAGCHGANLDGKPPPPQQQTPNLTVIVPNWSKEDFFNMERKGVSPEGYVIDNKIMPWKATGKLDDVELEALYLYLHNLKPMVVK